MPSAAQLLAQRTGVHPGAGAYRHLHCAGPQLPQRHAAVGALHQCGQGAQFLNIRVGGLHLLPQRQGYGHHHHTLTVKQLHFRHHAGFHGQPHPALGAEQRFVHCRHVHHLHQGRRDAVGAGGGVGVLKAAAVGADRHIQRQRDLRRQRRQMGDDLIDHLAAGGAVRLQTGVAGKEAVGRMVVNGQLDTPGVRLGVLGKQAHIGNIHADHMVPLPALRSPVGGSVGGVGGGDLRIGQQIRRAAAPAQCGAQGRGAANGVAVRSHMGQQQHVVQRVQISGGLPGCQDRSFHLTYPPAARCPRWRDWRA